MSNFQPFAEKMTAEGLPDVAIRTFAYYYEQLAAGATGLIPESEIEPVASLPDADQLDEQLADVGQQILNQTVLMKLNGGLGTSMGLSKAKALLPVRDGLSFLDIIAKQAQLSAVPLVLMNSFNTQADSLATLANYPDLGTEIPLDFLQHKVPKITQGDLTPASYTADPTLEWCPPGHGDIYTALVTSGMLEQLLAKGYKYVFVSNADNLGAVMDTKILGYFAQNDLPFMMEVADRTAADKKGGHLAKRPDGQLILRESAQCPEEDTPAFQDITRHKYFNTNNLWLNLVALEKVLAQKDGILGLPMIRNSKTVNPRDGATTPVYQLETAMGSAIAVFAGAGAIRVRRTRFAPVKKTNDLLAVRSDAYIMTEDFRVILNPARQGSQVVVDLDSSIYKLIDQMEARFPHGAPSLLKCTKLTVNGDVKFGRGITITGDVTITNEQSEQMTLAENSELSS